MSNEPIVTEYEVKKKERVVEMKNILFNTKR